MKLLLTAIAGVALLATPALAQSTDPDPSPSQRALQKPGSSDPAATVPDSSASSGESTGDAGYAEPSMDPDANALEPDEADRKAAEPDGPRE
jgi:opacity protein-like surface antigen